MNPDHKNQLTRINRISGQLDGIKKMVEEKRYCPDILAQLRAARSAITSLEALMLETHLNCCVTNAFNSQNVGEQQQKIKELVELFKRFES